MADLILSPTAHPQLPEIVSRYQAGETMSQLSKTFKCSRATLYNWMLGGLGEEQYYQIITECLVNRIAEADQHIGDLREQLLDDSLTQLDIARIREQISIAKEVIRYARFDYARRRPNLYGDKSYSQVDQTVIIVDRSLKPLIPQDLVSPSYLPPIDE